MSNIIYVIRCIADPEGIANAQKSLGIGQEEKDRRVRWNLRGKSSKAVEGIIRDFSLTHLVFDIVKNFFYIVCNIWRLKRQSLNSVGSLRGHQNLWVMDLEPELRVSLSSLYLFWSFFHQRCSIKVPNHSFFPILSALRGPNIGIIVSFTYNFFSNKTFSNNLLVYINYKLKLKQLGGWKNVMNLKSNPIS